MIEDQRDVFLSHASEDKSQFVRPFAEELDKRLPDRAKRKALATYQDLVEKQPKDLERDLRKPGVGKAVIHQACRDLINAMNSKVKVESAYVGPAFQYSCGLSVYFPWAEVKPEYKGLDFARATGWYGFLDKYVESTRRKPRDEKFKPTGFFFQKVMNPKSRREKRIVKAISNHRTSDPDTRRDALIKSMKNPPLAWRVCDAVKRKCFP